MDIFTMVIMACVGGEPACRQARISEPGFVSLEACEARIDAITYAMTKELALEPALKGREVTYDVSCMNQTQLKAKLGVTQSDI